MQDMRRWFVAVLLLAVAVVFIRWGITGSFDKEIYTPLMTILGIVGTALFTATKKKKGEDDDPKPD